MRLIALVLVVCCTTGGLILSGEEPPFFSELSVPSAAQPTFRSGVELVTIDVVATDLSGKPVHGLKTSDFELFEDGKSQPIKAFQFVDSSTVSTETVAPPGIVTNSAEPGAIFAVVLDELGFQVEDTLEVRRVAERFFNETLQPNDQVALVRAGVNSGFFLTNDRSMAIDAIRATSGRRERTLGLEAPGGSTPAVVESEPTIETFGSGENSRDSFRVLFGVVDHLKQIRARRKAVLWFSRGGSLPSSFTESIEYGRNVGRDDDVFAKLIATARAANVAIYTVDPRGLQSAAAEVSRDLQPFDTTTLRDLAGFTGGRALLGNEMNATLAKVAAENRSYYLLGYEPASGGNRSKARKIRVTAKVPGVSVLHRAVYLPSTEIKAAPTALIASPLPISDLPIALAPAAVALDRSKRGVLLPFEIGRDLRDNTTVEYTAIALDASGKTVARAAGKGVSKNGRLVGDIGLPVEAKAYSVRFAAKALNPDIEGVAFATVRVPDGKAKDLECGGIVFEQPAPRTGLRQFSKDLPLTISTLVSAEKLTGALSFGLGPAGGVPQRLWPAALDQQLAPGVWRIALNLKGPLPVGNLEICVMRDELLAADSCLTQFSVR